MSEPKPQPIVVNMPQRRKTHHIFHAILTVATGGIWGIVWLVQYLRHGER